MTKWLASVKSLDEARQLTGAWPDIIDMKDPANGALGALPVAEIKAIVDYVGKRTLTSATIGDINCDAEEIIKRLQKTESTGVDYLKVGLFNQPQLASCLHELSQSLTTVSTPVIAVLFADEINDAPLLTTIKQAGFAGVMLDTASKNGLGLLDHWTLSALHRFVETARNAEMLCGLAGALRIEDIDKLAPLGADYLGFRSALCDRHQRTSKLDPDRAAAIQHRLYQFRNLSFGDGAGNESHHQRSDQHDANKSRRHSDLIGMQSSQ